MWRELNSDIFINIQIWPRDNYNSVNKLCYNTRDREHEVDF